MSVERSSVLEAALDRISDAARESARLHKVMHWVEWDEPSVTSHRLQHAVCGRWISPREVAIARDDVSCVECRQELPTGERQEI